MKASFHIGPIEIYSYGFLIAVGVIAAFYAAEFRAKKLGLDSERVWPLGGWCAVGGFLGAKLMYVITEWKNLFSGELSFSDIMYGFVVYGGIILGIFSGYLYTRIKKLNFLQYFDLVMPSIALAQGFGRLGCFMAGCCYGKETTAWYGMKFQDSVYHSMRNVKVIPTQLVMSIADFAHFVILIFIAKVMKKKGKDGVVAGCYLTFYSIGRFLIEFLRDDPRGPVFSIFSVSQCISFASFLAGAGMLCYFLLVKPKKNQTEE